MYQRITYISWQKIITIINVELRLKSRFEMVSFRSGFAIVSFRSGFAMVSFRSGFAMVSFRSNN